MFLDRCNGLCLVNLSRGWLILGWCCGFEIWDGANGFKICGWADLSGFFFFFFFSFKVVLVDVGLCQ